MNHSCLIIIKAGSQFLWSRASCVSFSEVWRLSSIPSRSRSVTDPQSIKYDTLALPRPDIWDTLHLSSQPTKHPRLPEVLHDPFPVFCFPSSNETIPMDPLSIRPMYPPSPSHTRPILLTCLLPHQLFQIHRLAAPTLCQLASPHRHLTHVRPLHHNPPLDFEALQVRVSAQKSLK